MSEMERLRGIIEHLRGPDGCPWDREQTPETLGTYLLEETYEALEAIAQGSPGELCEELGDLLLQVVLQAQIARERGHFGLDDVARCIADKIVRRHPHVFGRNRLSTSAQVLKQWEQIKADERSGGRGGSLLSGVPRSLPALLKALRISTKASRVGFDWPDREDLLAKVDEELEEMKAAMRAADATAVREELGDLLFTLANVGRQMEIDPEEALQDANRKFQDRFERMEAALAAEGLTPAPDHRGRMEALWMKVKRISRPSTDRTAPSDGTSGTGDRRDRRERSARAPRAARTASRQGSRPGERGRPAPRRAARARSRR